jgi:hypothetical protein
MVLYSYTLMTFAFLLLSFWQASTSSELRQGTLFNAGMLVPSGSVVLAPIMVPKKDPILLKELVSFKVFCSASVLILTHRNAFVTC